MATDDQLHARIRDALARFGKLPGGAAQAHELGLDDDLFRAGLTSHASVNVMLGLEDAFDVEFPDALLTRTTFESVAAMAAALRTLLPEAVTV